ncbi:MAG: (2Fe-2S)-binding protein [Flavobacteriaceae bacterium]|nr:MAG: (2Fe-2S)-binding protein [Flavobacteriaceae bacterium]
MMITLKINGQKHSIDVEDDMPLLWAIRDIIGLTGTKYGCGKGLCGACTVLLDNSPVRSCIVPVTAAVGKSIFTIEGTSTNLKKLQEAWVSDNVAQCGFCQPGQLITATSLLNKTPNPSESEIDLAMHGNICRCGTYTRIKQAIQKTVQSNQ